LGRGCNEVVQRAAPLGDGRRDRVDPRRDLPHRDAPGADHGRAGPAVSLHRADSTVIILGNTGTTDLDEFVAQVGKLLVP